MDPLATYEQLASSLRETPDVEQATQALTAASGIVRGITRQTFTFVSQETVILAGLTKVLTLPQRPLVVDGSNPLAIVELGDYGGIDFVPLENRDYTRIGNELSRGMPWWNRFQSRLQGWPYLRPFGVWAPRVQVTYSHGYTVIPDEVSAVVLDAAKSLYTNPTGLRSFTTPEYSEVYAVEALGAATVQGIKARLSDLGYRRGAFSVG